MNHVIVTKYLGATNTRSSRVRASMGQINVSVPWDHGLDVEANHFNAIRQVCQKAGIQGTYHYGTFGNGFAVVVTPVDVIG